MAANKTTENDSSVTSYINAIADEMKRKDCTELVDLFSKQSGFPPKMWSTSIVGFGSYHYKYESGREGDAPLVALSARANAIVLYLHAGAEEVQQDLKVLGKHKTGKGCIYIKQLTDVDLDALKKIIRLSVTYAQKKYRS